MIVLDSTSFSYASKVDIYIGCAGTHQLFRGSEDTPQILWGPSLTLFENFKGTEQRHLVAGPASARSSQETNLYPLVQWCNNRRCCLNHSGIRRISNSKNGTKLWPAIQGLGSMAEYRCLRRGDRLTAEPGTTGDQGRARARVMRIEVACTNMVGSPTFARHSEINLSQWCTVTKTNVSAAGVLCRDMK